MTERFLLDSNAITHAVRHPTGPVAQQIDRHRPAVLTSVIVEAELRFGVAHQPGHRMAGRVRRFLDNMEIVPFDSAAATHYGDIRDVLTARGDLIDAMDLLIAGHARSMEATVITHNVAHFRRVPDLKWLDWQQLANST